MLPAPTTGAAATPAPLPPPVDFAGMGYTEAAVYDPTSGSFLFIPSNLPGTAGIESFAFGPTGAGQTIPAVADYQGLGFDQVAAYLPTSGVYAILPNSTSAGLFERFGVPGAGQTIPVPADYYGTGQADVAVYIPSQAVFAIQDPTGKTAGESLAFGIPGVGESIPGSGGLLRDRPG